MFRSASARVNTGVLLAAALLVAGATASAAAQNQAPKPYKAVVVGNDVYLRAGAGSTYYPFGKLYRGDIVTVAGERFGWSQVLTTGVVFEDLFAYVRANEIRPSADGTTGVTLGKVDVIAPNANRNNAPDSSWKWIVQLPPETKVNLLGIVRGDKDDFYQIALPENGSAWVSANFLKPATAEDIAAFEASLREDPAAAAPPTTPPATQETNVTQTPPAAAPPADATPLVITSPIPAEADEEPAVVEPPAETEQSPPAATVQQSPVAPAEEPAEPEKALAEVTLDDLESAYEDLKTEPIRDAEIDPLRQRYLALLEEKDAGQRVTAIAKARVQLLEARLRLQQQVLEVDAVRNRANTTIADADAARLTIEMAAEYAAVGRISSSTIYDGRRLPRLLRLVDPGTGRTIAYLEPDASNDYTSMLGQIVGIVGDKSYDGSLRLMVIAPKRIDLLTPRE